MAVTIVGSGFFQLGSVGLVRIDKITNIPASLAFKFFGLHLQHGIFGTAGIMSTMVMIMLSLARLVIMGFRLGLKAVSDKGIGRKLIKT